MNSREMRTYEVRPRSRVAGSASAMHRSGASRVIPESSSATRLVRRRQRQGFAVARDRTPIYFEVTEAHPAAREAGKQVPMVFTDGIGCDGFVWKYLAQEMAKDRDIIHWHYRGHGESGLPRDEARVTIADCADDLLSVLDTIGVGRAVLAGHSMGVQVSLETWRRAHDRVAGLVLVCGSYGNPLRTFRGQHVLEDIFPALRFLVHRVPRLVTTFWRNILPTDLAFQVASSIEINADLIHREDFFPYLEHISRVDVRLFLDMLAAAGRHTAREILPLIDCPTLIVAGDRDRFTPLSLLQEMHGLIPSSELHIVEQGSHTAPIEKPSEVNQRVARFVRTRIS